MKWVHTAQGSRLWTRHLHGMIVQLPVDIFFQSRGNMNQEIFGGCGIAAVQDDLILAL